MMKKFCFLSLIATLLSTNTLLDDKYYSNKPHSLEDRMHNLHNAEHDTYTQYNEVEREYVRYLDKLGNHGKETESEKDVFMSNERMSQKLSDYRKSMGKETEMKYNSYNSLAKRHKMESDVLEKKQQMERKVRKINNIKHDQAKTESKALKIKHKMENKALQEKHHMEGVIDLLKFIEGLVKQLSWKQYFEKVYPGKIPGPKSYDDRIAVVGAGPSGVHMAYLLKEKGFKNITIFEESDRIGGKSKSLWYRGVTHEMGTCYYAGGYEQIEKLVREFTTSDMMAEKLTYVWNSTTTESIPQDLPVYILQGVMNEYPGISRFQAIMKLTLQVARYLRRHVEIFGLSLGQLPPKPKNMEELRGNFLDYLNRNNMKDLRHLFVSSQTFYGRLDEIPALYGLIWNTPQVIFGALQSFLLGHKSYGILTNGFQDLWEKIALKNKLNIRYNTKVTNLDFAKTGKKLSGTAPIQIEVSVNTNKVEKCEFDFVVWSPKAKDSLWSFSGTDMKEEKELFEGMTHSYYSTSLINEIGTKRSQAPEDWFFGNIKNAKENNLVWADRDSYSVVNRHHGPEYELGLTETGDDDSPMRTMVVYQYSNSETVPRTEELLEKIDTHFNKMGTKTYSIKDRNKWLYFPRFNQTQTEQGNHWKVLDIQGKKSVWYIGSSTSFESVKSCVEYNLLLIDRMVKPESSHGEK